LSRAIGFLSVERNLEKSDAEIETKHMFEALQIDGIFIFKECLVFLVVC